MIYKTVRYSNKKNGFEKTEPDLNSKYLFTNELKRLFGAHLHKNAFIRYNKKGAELNQLLFYYFTTLFLVQWCANCTTDCALYISNTVPLKRILCFNVH